MFALAIYLIIPVSVKITCLIEETFDKSISQTMESVEEISEEAEKVSEDNDKNVFTQIISKITDKMEKFVEKAKGSLSIFVDAIAVMIITTCIIPIGVVCFFVWIVKIMFGVNIDVSKGKKLISTKKQENEAY